MVLSEADKKEIKKILENLEKEIEILYFKDENEQSKIFEEVLKEICSLSDKAKLEYLDKEKVKELGFEKGPLVTFKNYENIIFLGTPAGTEFQAFIETLRMLGSEVKLSKGAEKIKEINKKIEIWVFTTPTCPYCRMASLIANKFAIVNKNIKAVTINAPEFPEFIEEYMIVAVPKVVVKEGKKDLVIWEGALPEHAFAEKILNALH